MLPELDAEWLKKYYPGLTISDNHKEIRGELIFSAAYNKDIDKFLVLRENDKNIIDGLMLNDSYGVTIRERLPHEHTVSKLPALSIDEGKVDLSMKRHFNLRDKSACVCGPIEEQEYLRRGYSFITFFDQLVIPFLYEQTYYDKYGDWPWGEYGHGSIGIFASYFLFGDSSYLPGILERLKNDINWLGIVKSLLSQKGYVKGHTICWCGKNKAIRKCHPETWQGINKLREDLKKII